MIFILEVSKSVVQFLIQVFLIQEEVIVLLGWYGYGWVDFDVVGVNVQCGFFEVVVCDIFVKKNEFDWMLQLWLKVLCIFDCKFILKWGFNFDGIDFDNIKYFVCFIEKQVVSWDDLLEDICNIYDWLGILQVEKQRLVVGVVV